jgi:hypothetical protein
MSNVLEPEHRTRWRSPTVPISGRTSPPRSNVSSPSTTGCLVEQPLRPPLSTTGFLVEQTPAAAAAVEVVDELQGSMVRPRQDRSALVRQLVAQRSRVPRAAPGSGLVRPSTLTPRRGSTG